MREGREELDLAWSPPKRDHRHQLMTCQENWVKMKRTRAMYYSNHFLCWSLFKNIKDFLQIPSGLFWGSVDVRDGSPNGVVSWRWLSEEAGWPLGLLDWCTIDWCTMGWCTIDGWTQQAQVYHYTLYHWWIATIELVPLRQGHNQHIESQSLPIKNEEVQRILVKNKVRQVGAMENDQMWG